MKEEDNIYPVFTSINFINTFKLLLVIEYVPTTAYLEFTILSVIILSFCLVNTFKPVFPSSKSFPNSISLQEYLKKQACLLAYLIIKIQVEICFLIYLNLQNQKLI